MSMNEVEKEWRRLYQDFESHASQYHDLTLSIDYRTPHHRPELPSEKPNHVAVLWQYFGNAGHDFNADEFDPTQQTDYGHPSAKVTAYGLIAGVQTGLFKRMAHRAGSLLPDEFRIEITRRIMENVVDPEAPGKPVFGCNQDPLATWLNFLLMIGSTLQPERFRRRTLPIDPFTASLAPIDFLLNYKPQQQSAKDVMDIAEFTSQRFKIALSFPGEKREFISKIAEDLSDRLGQDSIFYDKYYEAELARPDLDDILQKVYHDNSELVVVFLCEEYTKKEWCGLEWRAVKDLIKKRRDADIMIMRFDDCEISGLYSIDGYADLRDRSPKDAADLIYRRLESRKKDGERSNSNSETARG